MQQVEEDFLDTENNEFVLTEINESFEAEKDLNKEIKKERL